MKNMLLFLKSRLILCTSLGMLKDTAFVNRMLVHCSTQLNNTLTDNKYEMCCLLAKQFNSVFTMPKQTSVIKDPVTYFLSPVTCFLSHATREDDLFLTDITLSDSIIIEAIKELSPNSAGGLDGIPTSLLINCAEEIAAVLKNIFFTLPLF